MKLLYLLPEYVTNAGGGIITLPIKGLPEYCAGRFLHKLHG